jgi:hypothetical protein
MSKSSFEQKVEQGFYAIGRQRDRLAFEKRRLAKQLRFTQHAARLENMSKKCDFAMVFLAAVGTIPLFLVDGQSMQDFWPLQVPCVLSLLLGFLFAWRGKKVLARQKSFHERFGNWRG